MNAQYRRRGRLMPNGIPKYIRLYDNRDTDQRTLDFLTVVYTGNYQDYMWADARNRKSRLEQPDRHPYTAMNGAPFHPQMGICMHGESENVLIDRPTYGHLGKQIKWADLADLPDCMTAIIQEYLDLWDLRDNGVIEASKHPLTKGEEVTVAELVLPFSGGELSPDTAFTPNDIGTIVDLSFGSAEPIIEYTLKGVKYLASIRRANLRRTCRPVLVDSLGQPLDQPWPDAVPATP